MALGAAGCSRMDGRLTAYLSSELPFPLAADARVAVRVGSEPREPLLEQEVARKIAWLLERRGYRTAGPAEATHVLDALCCVDRGTLVTEGYITRGPSDVIYSDAYGPRGRRVTVRREVPRYEQRSYTYAIFRHQLGLTLLDASRIPPDPATDPAALDAAIVWRCAAAGVMEDSDLRSAVDLLLAESFEYLGRDSGRQVKFSIGPGDDRVEALRRRFSPADDDD